jgi:hypothetical protein
MNPVYIEAVGLYAPGLTGWAESQAILRGDEPYAWSSLPRYKPVLLPANERRRATESVRIAFGACEDAVAGELEKAAALAAVFVSSGGDYAVHDQICRGLMQEPVVVSPTQFHNSVHNAAAGYWSIASNSRAPSVSLSAFDCSVSAGLLEAIPLVCQERLPMLLVFSDCAVVGPMHQQRPIDDSFAAALWLTPDKTARSIATMALRLGNTASPVATPINAALAALGRNNPAAQILPLLEGLARKTSAQYHFPNAAGQAAVVTLDCGIAE